MVLRDWVRSLAALSVLCSSTLAPAASLRPRDCCTPAPAADCAPQSMATCTVMVPEWTTELRTVCVTEMKQEPRTKTVFVPTRTETPKEVVETIVKRVPVTRTHTLIDTVFHCVKSIEVQKFVVNCPRIERRTITETIYRPFRTSETVEVTVLLPYVEQRQGVRQRCRLECEKVMKTITRDCGHFISVPYEVPACVGCNKDQATTITQCRRVWVPKLVQEQVPVTCWKPVFYPENYTYCATAYRPETRTVTRCVTKLCPEQVTRDVCVLVSNMKEFTREVPVTKLVPEEIKREVTSTQCEIQTEDRVKTVIDVRCGLEARTVTYMATVPVVVKKQVEVKVCKMVPKVMPVPAGKCCN